jgi:phage portal protein BeeE
MSAVRMAREAIGLTVALERQQAKLAGNGGKPSGILSFKKALSPESREKLRQSWQDKFGVNGDGGIAVLDTAAPRIRV